MHLIPTSIVPLASGGKDGGVAGDSQDQQRDLALSMITGIWLCAILDTDGEVRRPL